MQQNAMLTRAKRNAISYKTDFKIILKIQLVENKEVTLLVELNW